MHIVVEYFTANYISTFITFTSDKTTKLSRLKRYTCCILVINEDESREDECLCRYTNKSRFVFLIVVFLLQVLQR